MQDEVDFSIYQTLDEVVTKIDEYSNTIIIIDINGDKKR